MNGITPECIYQYFNCCESNPENMRCPRKRLWLRWVLIGVVLFVGVQYLFSDPDPSVRKRNRIVPQYTFRLPSDEELENGRNEIKFPEEKVGLDPQEEKREQLKLQKEINQLLEKEARRRDAFKVLSRNETNPDIIGIIKTEDDEKTKNRGYQTFAFNTLISDRLGYHRAIPDTRNPACKTKDYQELLPSASVIICFYNEHRTTLLRSVHSVIDRSPSQDLHEIILVDDFSSLDELKTLQNYLSREVPIAKLYRTKRREGLIRARMFGASKATGEVLVFLDSHVEVNVDWLEPLLNRISEDRKTVVIPVIDTISPDTFLYEASPLVRGGFSWGLHYRWDPLPPKYRDHPETLSNPIETPTMAGGLFAIERYYFDEMGKYDPGMDLWGGENLEISFRIWMCGGRLEIIPCSRVGHVFRKRRPYTSTNGENTMLKNSLRVAFVWMDKYREHFFRLSPNARLDQNYGDISERKALRKRLRCTSFKWYLDNIYPEQVIPDANGNVQSMLYDKSMWKRRKSFIKTSGKIVHAQTGLCVESIGEPYEKRSKLRLNKCQKVFTYKKQLWSVTGENEFKLANALCLETSGYSQSKIIPKLMKCHGGKGTQEWHWISKGQSSLLYNNACGKCLGVNPDPSMPYLLLEICDMNNERMRFYFQSKENNIPRL